MIDSGLLLDGVLVLLLLWLAWRVLSVPDLFEGTVLFIAFGLLLSLAWVRLQAPDVALAEAAIGAGMTGALVLSALKRLGVEEGETPPRVRPSSVLLPLMALCFFTALAGAVWSLPPALHGVGPLVATHLGESGVKNPVTAVLLNFRGYDTLLEIGVLFLAVAAVWSLAQAETAPVAEPGDVMLALVRLLGPVLVLASGYLLWRGSDAPGGAFQGGAVLAAGGVLLLLAGYQMPGNGWPLRVALSGGLGFFVAVAAGVTLFGGRVLEYPPGMAKGWILLVEAVLTPAIALTLIVLFAGGRPPEDRPKKEEER